jgi:hypothetical protein
MCCVSRQASLAIPIAATFFPWEMTCGHINARQAQLGWLLSLPPALLGAFPNTLLIIAMLYIWK